tara:strand:- start:4 stop:303 length:300 start_codon:yes stop_codon:yes gene_type:complete
MKIVTKIVVKARKWRPDISLSAQFCMCELKSNSEKNQERGILNQKKINFTWKIYEGFYLGNFWLLAPDKFDSSWFIEPFDKRLRVARSLREISSAFLLW